MVALMMKSRASRPTGMRALAGALLGALVAATLLTGCSSDDSTTSGDTGGNVDMEQAGNPAQDSGTGSDDDAPAVDTCDYNNRFSDDCAGGYDTGNSNARYGENLTCLQLRQNIDKRRRMISENERALDLMRPGSTTAQGMQRTLDENRDALDAYETQYARQC